MRKRLIYWVISHLNEKKEQLALSRYNPITMSIWKLKAYYIFLHNNSSLTSAFSLPLIFIFLSCCCNKTLTENNLRRKRLILPHRLQYIKERNWSRTQGKKWSRTMEECFILVCFPGFLCYLSSTVQPTCLGITLPTLGWTVLHQWAVS